jgi:hypothetical protein
MVRVSATGVRESRRRLVRLLVVLASPVFILLGVAAVVFGLTTVHDDARWTAVPEDCPTLGGEAAVLLVDLVPPTGDVRAGGLESQDCHYPGTLADLGVSVRLHRGGLLHGSHGTAIGAVGDNPPADFRPLGPPDGDGRQFGSSGPGADRLVLISVVDNAEVRVQYDHPGLAAAVVDVALFRVPLQAVADRAIANLG